MPIFSSRDSVQGFVDVDDAGAIDVDQLQTCVRASPIADTLIIARSRATVGMSVMLSTANRQQLQEIRFDHASRHARRYRPRWSCARRREARCARRSTTRC